MLTDKLSVKIKKFHQLGLIRKRVLVSQRLEQNNTIVINNNKYINFSSNDYLGLTKHPRIIKKLRDSISKYGFGSNSSALISGFFDSHYKLENDFANWLGFDKAIIFSSGYAANLSIISTLANRHNTIVSDKLCHSSILEGIQLSRAKNYRYNHCSIKHLCTLIQSKNPEFIITEGVFSMEGTITPLKEIINLSEKYTCNTIIDDAHGIGVLGKNGRGICEQDSIRQHQFGCLIIPLGKAFNGIGAIVAGRKEILDPIIQFSKGFRYTTSLPPAICEGITETLSIIIEDEWRRDKLKEVIKLFINSANERNIYLSSYQITPIKSIIIGDNKQVLYLQKLLMSKGFFVSAIRPPTIPTNSSRLRISLNCLHTESQINLLLDSIKKVKYE